MKIECLTSPACDRFHSIKNVGILNLRRAFSLNQISLFQITVNNKWYLILGSRMFEELTISVGKLRFSFSYRFRYIELLRDSQFNNKLKMDGIQWYVHCYWHSWHILIGSNIELLSFRTFWCLKLTFCHQFHSLHIHLFTTKMLYNWIIVFSIFSPFSRFHSIPFMPSSIHSPNVFRLNIALFQAFT